MGVSEGRKCYRLTRDEIFENSFLRTMDHVAGDSPWGMPRGFHEKFWGKNEERPAVGDETGLSRESPLISA